MSVDKKPEQVIPGMVVPEAVPAGLPPEVMPSFPVPKVGPKDDIAPYVTPTQLAPVLSEHATIPPVASLGNGSTNVTLPAGIIDLEAVRRLTEKGSVNKALRYSAEKTERQLDRLEKAA